MNQADETGGVRVADWIMGHLADHGFRQVFMVAGGGAMHLNDAAGAQGDLEVVATLHEQGAAIAAEAYAKASGRMALCLVTTGPGGTNAVTGVTGAWLDSTPMLVLSGQVKRPDLAGTTGVRQRGVQEVDTVAIVGAITKVAEMVTDPLRIRYQLERALHLATTGRPGPVWLDIPLDVQAAVVDPDGLAGFDPAELPPPPTLGPAEVERAADEIAAAVAAAQRPLLYLGSGVHLAGAAHEARALAEALGVPVATTWPAQGIVGDEHPLSIGRPGALAPRGANFVLQNADLLVCLGARLDLITTGYDPKDFGRNAHKIVVDIDPAELTKLEGAIGQGICADAGAVIRALLDRAEAARPTHDLTDWRRRCADWRDRYPVVDESHRRPGTSVTTYHFAETLSEVLADDDVLATCCSGLGIEIFLLCLRLHTGQRAIYNTALGAMGYGPPTALGACLGSGRRRTVSVDGDGGLQLNVQELETIRRLDLPVKLFVMSNDGYASIRASQQRWFGRLVGADPSSGLTLPPLDRLAHAYGLGFERIDPAAPLAPQLRAVLDRPGPVLCEIPTPPDEPREPNQISERTADGGMRSRPIEDLAPLLDRQELAANMLEPLAHPAAR